MDGINQVLPRWQTVELIGRGGVIFMALAAVCMYKTEKKEEKKPGRK